MGQFATIAVPVALQAATTAWGQYQHYAVTEQRRREQALADQVAADTASRQAEIDARETFESASLTNEAAWDAHDLYAEDARRQAGTEIADLQRAYALDQQDQAEALRQNAASRRAHFAAMGLDAASGSAQAVLEGLGAEAADATRRARDDLRYRSTQVTEATDATVGRDWQSTADAVQARADQANLDVWARQNDLDLYLYNLGVRSAANQRQDLLDLTVSNQRALLGLGNRAAGSSLYG